VNRLELLFLGRSKAEDPRISGIGADAFRTGTISGVVVFMIIPYWDLALESGPTSPNDFSKRPKDALGCDLEGGVPITVYDPAENGRHLESGRRKVSATKPVDFVLNIVSESHFEFPQ